MTKLLTSRYKHDDPEINLDDFLVKDLAQLRKCHRLLAEKMSEKAGTNYSKSILQAQDVNSKPADELSLTGEKSQAKFYQAFSLILRFQTQRNIRNFEFKSEILSF